MGRVRVGSCNVANAASVRALLEAHGIAATTVGGGPYASFDVDVWVESADAEQAAALLAELDHSATATATATDTDSDTDSDSSDSIELRLQRKRHVGVAILLSCFITFGTGHFFARSFFRGLLLSALEITGIAFAAHGDPKLGLVMIFGAIALDAVGSTLRLRARYGRAALPIARTHR